MRIILAVSLLCFSFANTLFSAEAEKVVNIVVLDDASAEYRLFAESLRKGNSTFAGITRFIEMGEYSAYKTLLFSQGFLSIEQKISLLQRFLKDHPKHVDAWEAIGTLNWNAENIAEGIRCYEQATKYGTLSSDGFFNYITTLLHHFPKDKEKRMKSWLLLREYCQKFFPGKYKKMLSPEDQKNPLIREVYFMFEMLIKIAKENNHIEVINEMGSFEKCSDTHLSIKTCILQNLDRYIKGTSFEGALFRHTDRIILFHDELMSNKVDATQHMRIKSIKFCFEKIKLNEAIKSLDDLLWNNLAIILRNQKAMINLPKKEFKDCNNPTNREYTSWTRAIIDAHRAHLINYAGKDIRIHEMLSIIDNTTIEKHLCPLLIKMIEG